MVALFQRFPDDAAAEAWFVHRRWPNGVHCPHCGSTNVQTGAKHKTMPYRCREKECAKRFSAKTGTVMESSKLGFQVWMIATYLLSTSLKSVSSMKLHRDLNINQRSAWFLAHRLRKALAEEGDVFDGPVEVDETYFGGRRKNMSNAKRKTLKDIGRGAVGKTAVVGAKDRRTNKVAAKVVEHTGTFHKISLKHRDRYVQEFAARHNLREQDTINFMGTIVAGMRDKPLRYRDLIADNGLSNGAQTS